MFSATLHSPEVKRLAAAICQQPLLVDLKGKDAVPDTVDHVLVRVDPAADVSWLQSTPKVRLQQFSWWVRQKKVIHLLLVWYSSCWRPMSHLQVGKCGTRVAE